MAGWMRKRRASWVKMLANSSLIIVSLSFILCKRWGVQCSLKSVYLSRKIGRGGKGRPVNGVWVGIVLKRGQWARPLGHLFSSKGMPRNTALKIQSKTTQWTLGWDYFLPHLNNKGKGPEKGRREEEGGGRRRKNSSQNLWMLLKYLSPLLCALPSSPSTSSSSSSSILVYALLAFTKSFTTGGGDRFLLLLPPPPSTRKHYRGDFLASFVCFSFTSLTLNEGTRDEYLFSYFLFLLVVVGTKNKKDFLTILMYNKNSQWQMEFWLVSHL